MNPELAFSDLEMDALREIMNVGFGQAAANLAEIIDLHVILSVPRIVVIDSAGTADFIRQEHQDPASVSMVEQFFFGKFAGSSVLVIPRPEVGKLLGLFDERFDIIPAGPEADALQQDSLLEIGNIIIGACVGKIAEILGDVVRYDPPHFSPRFSDVVLHHAQRSVSGLALVFKTVFQFQAREVTGYLFIATSEESIRWIKDAVRKFLSSIS